jgi:hypothetical protein
VSDTPFLVLCVTLRSLSLCGEIYIET